MSQFVYSKTVVDYESFGEGIPILFLHGWGMDKRLMIGCFEPIFQNVGGYRRVYIDLPGMGKSVAGEVTSSNNMLIVLYEFAKEVLGKKFIIVGESFGGYLARGFVKEYPDNIDGILLLCPLVYPGYRQGSVEVLNVKNKDEEFLGTLTKEQYDSFTYLNVVLTKPVWERYKLEILPALETQNSYFLNEVLEGSFSFDVDDMEKPCSSPCLIIVGKQDTEVGYKDQFELMKNYPNSTYCAISHAGHNLQIEQSEMFENIVRQWFVNLN